jgi:hypothetical protein
VTDSEDTYQAAAEIADRLLAKGLPILGFMAVDAGCKAAFAIALPDGSRTAFRVPRDNLNAGAVEEIILAYL